MLRFFQSPWGYVERLLDRTGMYRVVTLGLSALAVVALGAGLFGLLPYTFAEQFLSLLMALVVALLLNALAAVLWRAHVNYESAVITALIVHFLVLPVPLTAWTDLWQIAAVTALAVLSKFVLAWRGQHVVNPAAFGAVALAGLYVAFPLPGYFETAWWLGNPVMFVPLAIVGVFVVIKVRKWAPVVAFLGVGFAVFLFEEWRFSGDPLGNAARFWLSGPSLFLACFMLTEPFTMPPRKHQQVWYGVVIGALSQTTLLVPLLKMTPELALVIGNVLFYPATLRRKLIMPLQSVRTIAERTYELVFTKPSGLTFVPGQYLEWMLPHAAADTRGVRRYFTIASSPTEPALRLALRVPPEKESSYKRALLALTPGEHIIASQLAGDFILPKDPSIKLGFIAGGIGITPFRSHLKYLADKDEKRDAVLFYCNNTTAEIAYREEFTAIANVFPLRVVQVLAKEKGQGAEFEEGFITEDVLRRRTPDYLERTWYLSGPPPMVNAYTKLLKGMGVSERRIVRDFFPGLA